LFTAVSPKPYALLLLRVATPLLVLLSRTHNAILFSVFELQLELLHLWFCSDTETPSTDSVASILPKPVVATSILLALTQCTFFLMGNSNSLSSVDLGNAYIGVDDYNIGFTGLLTFVSNWSGSIWWTIAGISIIVDGYWQSYKPAESEVQHLGSNAVTALEDNDENEDDTVETPSAEGSKSAISSDLLSYYLMYYIYFAFFFSVALSTLTISVTILRQHLFIWTVFSPKFLFQGAWITLYHCAFQTLISTFLVVVWIPWCIT
jgi:ethanolaminephosphotransferase